MRNAVGGLLPWVPIGDLPMTTDDEIIATSGTTSR
jgi:hypothetical protein